ncbi:hypothetical protein A3Q56_07429 [Intoshia linei]|uniref:Cyclic nucleotide-binding domain-containing protein n=1 Tax=Intoshia linei TaxID=1819745 RepID=A0A177AS22_9BILA|nr:hypothetical protein A3Q56_07429 [Intoshia linei]
MKFETNSVPPGDVIVYQGEIIEELCFITKGSFEAVSNDIVYAFLTKGDIFGENIYIYEDKGLSGYNIRAMSYCEVHKITRSQLFELFSVYIDFSENFAKKLKVTFNLRYEVPNCFNYIKGGLKKSKSSGDINNQQDNITIKKDHYELLNDIFSEVKLLSRWVNY